MTILQDIARETGVPCEHLLLVARTADYRYKTYTIPKRAGGSRVIQHPARELKFLQRWISRRILVHARVHPAATAYQYGASVQRNAAMHIEGRYFLKLDFKDFFPSISVSDVTLLLRGLSGPGALNLSSEDIEIVGKVVTRRGKLTIGSPTSPVVSNAVMYDFDDEMSRLAAQRSSVYTRYADDIVFSTNKKNVLSDIFGKIREDIRNRVSPHLTINEQKISFTSKKKQVRITGLIITDRKRLSIGRSSKRIIKSMIYEYTKGRLANDLISYLSGYLAYVRGVEPEFMTSLQQKYSVGIINDILRRPLVMRKIYPHEQSLLQYILLREEKLSEDPGE